MKFKQFFRPVDARFSTSIAARILLRSFFVALLLSLFAGLYVYLSSSFDREIGGLKEQVQQSVNFSEHANHETGHSRLRNIVTTWRLNEPSLPD